MEALLHLLHKAEWGWGLPSGAARWWLVRVSMGLEPSELRVDRGLATGAVDLAPASPVQRRVNRSVGP